MRNRLSFHLSLLASHISYLSSLTNYVPPVCDSHPELASMVGDRDDPEWFVLDVDELPGPDERH